MATFSTCSVLVLAPLLALTACGGSTKKVDPAADLALAKGAVLTSADLSDYTAAPHTESDDIPAPVKKDFATCMKVSSTIFDDKPGAQKANSSDFSKQDAQISNAIEIDPKKSDVDEGWTQISKQGTEPCLQKLFEAAVKQSAGDSGNVTFGGTSVTRFDVKVGSRSIGYTVKITASSAGDSATFYVDVVFVQRDRAGIDLEFFNVGKPLDRAFELALVQKVYDRLGDKAK